MKKANRIFIVTGSILILLSTVVMANSASFSLGPDDTWTSSKTSNPWYYNTGVIDVGVTNFKGGTASMQFMEVRRFAPDVSRANFYMDSNNSSYYQRTINVSDQNAYYYTVSRYSGYPSGTVYGR